MYVTRGSVKLSDLMCTRLQSMNVNAYLEMDNNKHKSSETEFTLWLRSCNI